MTIENQQAAALIAENKAHYDAIDFGLEVRAFLGSKIGKHLIERAEGERETALAQLVEICADDAGAIRALQSTIRRAESIQVWLAEIIQEGYSAQEQLLMQDQIIAGGREE